MVHKRFSTPTSGSNPEKLYGVDWNKLIAGLEGEVTADPFTLNIDYHVIKHSTTNVVGDLYKSDGTKIIRFSMGSADQIIHVKSDGTDIEWIDPVSGGASELTDLTDIVITSVADNEVLTWDSTTSKWINQSLPAGTWDPDAVETVTNKTFSTNLNTLNHSTTNVAGDILKGNGTKFDRFAKGTANQYLKVNSGGTDLEWGTIADPNEWDPNSTEEITNKTINSDTNTITNIVDADIKAAAGIAWSKLNSAWVNVKDHGALGNGTSDDSTAFTDALTALPAEGGTIYVPQGTYRIDNFTINRNNVRLLGASWASVLQSLTTGADCIRIDLAGVETSREDIVIENLYIKGKGTGTSGNGITNRHSGSLFAAASDTNLDYTVIRHCKFTDYASGKNAIDLRNVDNRLLISHNRFTTILGKDVVIEANGRAGGNINISDNGMTHGAPQGCIELISNATNIKRTNIISNTIVVSQGANAIPAIKLQNDGGTIEHVNIIGNTIEDAKYGVDVGGAGAGLIKDVKINNNFFFHRTDPAESGARCIILRAVARGCYVTNNYYEGDPDTSITPIENLNTTAPLNFIYEKAENFVNSTTYITENGGTSAAQSGDGSDTTFTIAHGLNITPTYVHAIPALNDAIGSYWLTKDATNITVNYVVAPPSGSSNLQWYWRAA